MSRASYCPAGDLNDSWPPRSIVIAPRDDRTIRFRLEPTIAFAAKRSRDAAALEHPYVAIALVHPAGTGPSH